MQAPPGTQKPRILYFTHNNAPNLAKILVKKEWWAFCELLPCTHEAPVVTLPQGAEFFLRVHSLTAYQVNLAEILTHFLSQWGDLQESTTTNLYTSLQEAIANALIHGNLDIMGNRRNTQELHHFYAQIEQCLKEAEFANRALDISAKRQQEGIAITITDNGKGFDAKTILQQSRLEAQPQGNGLHLIHACCSYVAFCDDGRTIHMHLKQAQ